MSLTAKNAGGICATAYEHMKVLAGALEAAAYEYHGMRLHPGPVSECGIPICAERVRLLRWASHLEKYREDPDYAGRDLTYEEITQP